MSDLDWGDAPTVKIPVIALDERDTKDAGGYSGGDARMMSKGDTATGDNAGGDGACRNCGETGHFAGECPKPRKGGEGGGCFNCGEEGHSKADCPNPRVFKGECRVCKKEGHPAAQCPDKKADVCRNCKREGHKAAICTENRFMDLSGVEDLKPEEAWAKLAAADSKRELDDFREAFKEYIKSVPETTYEQMERALRHHNFNIHIIAYEKEVTSTYTLMDLQGKLDCKYHVGFFFSDKPQRSALKEAWPRNPEENLARLKDAGIPVERGIPKCSNCDELGHIAKSCPQEKLEREVVGVKCVNCEQAGHRARDCKEPRKDRFACRNCGQSGHAAAECTEPRSAAGVECKHCSEMGHFAKDCPNKPARTCRNCGKEGHMSKECVEPRNPATVTCRNCEQLGHFSKECPLPRDYSKVQCQNCKEMGHTKVRCKAPPAEDGDADAYGSKAGGFGSGAGGFDSGAAGYGGSAAKAGGDDDSGDDNGVTW